MREIESERECVYVSKRVAHEKDKYFGTLFQEHFNSTADWINCFDSFYFVCIQLDFIVRFNLVWRLCTKFLLPNRLFLRLNGRQSKKSELVLGTMAYLREKCHELRQLNLKFTRTRCQPSISKWNTKTKRTRLVDKINEEAWTLTRSPSNL